MQEDARVTDKEEVIRLAEPLRELIRNSKSPWSATREVLDELKYRRFRQKDRAQLEKDGWEIWEMPGEMMTHDLIDEILPERGCEVMGNTSDLLYHRTPQTEVAWSPEKVFPPVFDRRQNPLGGSLRVDPKGLVIPDGTTAYAPPIGELLWILSEYKARHGRFPATRSYFFSPEQYERSYRGAGGYDFSDGMAGRHAVGIKETSGKKVIEIVRLRTNHETGRLLDSIEDVVLSPIIIP